jgi:hypothetical protein
MNRGPRLAAAAVALVLSCAAFPAVAADVAIAAGDATLGGKPPDAAAHPDSALAMVDPLEQDLLLLPEPYFYDALGRRDLFVPLMDLGGDDPEDAEYEPTMQDLRILGILWGENDRYALIESAEGKSLILREGDPFGEGIVAEIQPDRVVLHITRYGGLRVKTLNLVQGGESNEKGNRRGR